MNFLCILSKSVLGHTALQTDMHTQKHKMYMSHNQQILKSSYMYTECNKSHFILDYSFRFITDKRDDETLWTKCKTKTEMLMT